MLNGMGESPVKLVWVSSGTNITEMDLLAVGSHAVLWVGLVNEHQRVLRHARLVSYIQEGYDESSKQVTEGQMNLF